jgi:LysM repeat protein
VEDPVLFRALFLFLLLAGTVPAQAAGFVVRPGDTLGQIARRYHVSVAALARANGITNPNLVQAGRVLIIPVRRHTFSYRVRWGDTLIGIGARFHLDLATIRAMNPSLGTYLLAGQWLRLCGPCTSGASMTVLQPAPSTGAGGGSTAYRVQPGDTLIGIASRFGLTLNALLTANRIDNPDLISIGSTLTIPRAWATPYDPWHARSMIGTYAQQYGIEASLPLAVGWQESGFNQNLISRTGAVGVMQVEPYTGQHIERLLGRPFNLYNLDDNIHAGVYWLATLVAYYGGDERMAVAAYYQGTKSIARHGFFQDTVQYVNNVLSLKQSFGG